MAPPHHLFFFFCLPLLPPHPYVLCHRSPPCFTISSSSHPNSPFTPITFSYTPLSPPPSHHPSLSHFVSHASIILFSPAFSSLFSLDLLDIPLTPSSQLLLSLPPSPPFSLSPEVDSSVRSWPYLPPLFAPVYIIDRWGCFSCTIHQHQLPSLLLPTLVLRLLAHIKLKQRD